MISMGPNPHSSNPSHGGVPNHDKGLPSNPTSMPFFRGWIVPSWSVLSGPSKSCVSMYDPFRVPRPRTKSNRMRAFEREASIVSLAL